jgi:hypothetical protein
LELLSPEERAAMGSDEAPGSYGILRRSDGSSSQLVGPATALLFLTLRDPMPLPGWVHRAFGGEAFDGVAALVAEGILEVESGASWGSGAALLHLPAMAYPAKREGPGAVSLQALRMAAGFAAANEAEMASFLYRYGTIPIGPVRAARWSGPDAVRAELGLDRIGPPISLSENRAWWMFAGAAALGSGPMPKLYAGIALAALPEALLRIAALWQKDRAGAPAFKIGASAPELHRPDRLVFYPASAAAAALWGERLAAAFDGLPPAPVAFTGAIDDAGLVSRGADPPRGSGHADTGTSWRAAVSALLAQALVAARAAGEREPWRYALERLRLAGIDPASWLPVEGWESLRGLAGREILP